MKGVTGREPEATSRGRPSLLRVPRRRPRWTLRRKLALLVLGTTFIPLAGLGALSYVVVVRRDTDSVLRQLDSVAAAQEARVEGLSVVVWNEQIAKPVAVRYAWADAPEFSLFNLAGFPASPFRTDDWPGVTADRF